MDINNYFETEYLDFLFAHRLGQTTSFIDYSIEAGILLGGNGPFRAQLLDTRGNGWNFPTKFHFGNIFLPKEHGLSLKQF